jgi:hypothetical protein
MLADYEIRELHTFPPLQMEKLGDLGGMEALGI